MFDFGDRVRRWVVAVLILGAVVLMGCAWVGYSAVRPFFDDLGSTPSIAELNRRFAENERTVSDGFKSGREAFLAQVLADLRKRPPSDRAVDLIQHIGFADMSRVDAARDPVKQKRLAHEGMEFQRQASEALQAQPMSIEARVTNDGARRRMAMFAVTAGEVRVVRDEGNHLIKRRSLFGGQPSRFDGHQLLGWAAVMEGDLDAAAKHLRESANHGDGVPTLMSFGPTMALADHLLRKGRAADVAAYLRQCRTFWELGQADIDRWLPDVEAGRVPACRRWNHQMRD